MPTTLEPSHLDALLPASTTDLVIGIDAQVVGTLEDDLLTGSDGADRMFGGDGWDILSALGDDDVLYGNTGLDTLESGTGDDLLYGGRDDDLLRGGTDGDTLFGGANSEPVYVLRDGVAVLLDGRDTLSGDAGDRKSTRLNSRP